MKNKDKRNKRLETVKSKGSLPRVANTSIRKKPVYLLLFAVVIVGVVAGFSLSSFISGSQKGIDYSQITDPSQLRGGETKPVLSPAYFVGQTSRTYQIAREIPEILDSVYCYCNCMIHSGHKSLLSCFTDLHGANCDICQNQALRAYELYKGGMGVVDVRKTIDKEFRS